MRKKRGGGEEEETEKERIEHVVDRQCPPLAMVSAAHTSYRIAQSPFIPVLASPADHRVHVTLPQKSTASPTGDERSGETRIQQSHHFE